LISDFNYELPKKFIAQHPVKPRDHSKLMILDNNNIQHRIFYEIPEYFENGDILILNNTKVLPAKIQCRKKTGGRLELLIMNLTDLLGNEGVKQKGPKPNDFGNEEIPEQITVESLIKGRVKVGTELEFEKLPITGIVSEHIDEGRYNITFIKKGNANSNADIKITKEGAPKGNWLIGIMHKSGVLPLPPYIKNEDVDNSLYQTVFSKVEGSIAAPTAGLHFTDSVFKTGSSNRCQEP
jgi:S-adenosylmethionine:tRNA ribosyltransferase-isomerase